MSEETKAEVFTAPDGEPGIRVTVNDEALRHVIAGLLSTIEFTPSKHHPEVMLPWADQILALFKPLAPN